YQMIKKGFKVVVKANSNIYDVVGTKEKTMSNMTVVAIYEDQALAETVIDDLVNNDHARQDIGLAVNPNTDEALVSVTVDPDDLDDTTFMMRQHNPKTIVARKTGWRQGENSNDLHPNEEDFTAVERKNKG